MKLKLAVLVLFAGLVMLACKKEKDPEPTPVNSSPNNNPTPSNATQFSGIFSTVKFLLIAQTSTISNIDSAVAYFSSTPQTSINPTTAVMVNSVTLNNMPMYYVGSYYYNSDSLGLSASETWSVNGANGIGTFTFANSVATPSATGYTSFPDTVSLSTGFTVSINNVNAGSASLFIKDQWTGFFIKTLNNGNNSIVITPSDLSSFTTSTNTINWITLRLDSKSAYVFSGKDYQFKRKFVYSKTVIIKP